MALTSGQVALFDIITNRIITLTSTLKTVPGMTQEQVDVATKQYEDLKDREMAILDSR